MQYTITAKIPTEQDTYGYTKRQAVALEQIALNTALIAGSSNVVTPVMTVIKSKPFDFSTIGSRATVGGSSEDITIINNNPNDDYIQVVGTINEKGSKEYIIDGIVFELLAT